MSPRKFPVFFKADFDQGQTPTIACVNKATVDLGVDFVRLINAIQIAVNQYLYPIWGATAHLVVSADLIPNAWGIVFVDDPTVAGAMGYHDFTPEGYPMSHVFVKTTLETGGSIAETASHEVFEMLINPGVQVGCLGPDGFTWYAREICDPCQNLYWYMPEYPDIPISDFVYPAYFESFRSPYSAKFDYMGKVNKPFEILPGGYMPVNKGGSWTQIFGSKGAEVQYSQDIHSRTPKLLKQREVWRVSELKTLEFKLEEKREIPIMMAALHDRPMYVVSDHDKNLAISLNLDWNKISGAIELFGPVVLDVAKELLDKGFTPDVVADVLSRLGTAVMEYLTQVKKTGEEGAKLWAASLIPGVPSSVTSPVLTWVATNVVLPALKKILPDEYKSLVDQYGPSLVTFIVGLLVKAGV